MKSSEPAQAPLLDRATVILLPFGWTNVVRAPVQRLIPLTQAFLDVVSEQWRA